ncbi:MAG: SDR family NAD(P)-dependent oxidoreductase [Halieaceae bacterium]|nr:SDR family NAD(P)-dependent oxidoreductase [Halieaceae bacterium]
MAQTILVTGVNGDIGRCIVTQALAQGKQVYATVRNEAHRETFPDHANLHFLMMHVDDEDSVKKAYNDLDQLLNGQLLEAVIHCAAIQSPSTVEFMSREHLEQTLKVNTLGSLAVMQSAFPRLRESGGNLVMASSLWGRVSGPMVASYAASKWALEALIHSARRETRGMGFSISTANIGVVKSRMVDSHVENVQALLDQAVDEERRFYGEAYASNITMSKKLSAPAISAEKVAKKLLQIADKENPSSRYTIGLDARALRFLDWILPDSIIDKAMGV